MVLRRRDASESDRRLTLLTEELGVVDAVAKGARKGGSRLGGSSEPLTVAAFHLAPGKRQLYVTQAQPITSYPGLRTDYDRLSLALALCELASAVLPHEQPAPEAFRFVVEAMRYLEIHEKPVVAAVWGETGLMGIEGFAPEWSNCVVTGTPVAEAEPFVSPSAGGYVSSSEAHRFADRLKVRAEVLFGLSRMAAQGRPPSNLKLAADCYRLLLRFWRHIADRPLPAREQAAASIDRPAFSERGRAE